jgi:hypothetical protein
VPRVIVRVTSHQGGWESHPQGKGAQVVRPKPPCGTRNAESHNGAECHLPPEATGVITGERSDTETVTLRSEGGGRKRIISGYHLGSSQVGLRSNDTSPAPYPTWHIRSEN